MSAKPFIYVFNVDDAELQNKDMQAKLAASVAPGSGHLPQRAVPKPT